MSGGRLNANVEQYLQAAAMNTPPPQVASDQLVAGATPIEQLLRVLGLAANLGDPQDNVTSAEQHAERDSKAREAAAKFATQDAEAAAELESMDSEGYTAEEDAASVPDQAAAMGQQLPQMASGIAGALAGALGGALQPLAQMPQQAAQGMQQAIQTGMGIAQQAGFTSAPLEDAALADLPPGEEVVDEADDPGGLAAVGAEGGGWGGGESSGAGAGGLGPVGGTAPMAYLGPPPVPPSAGTAPSSAPITPIPPAVNAQSPLVSNAGMAGMPMVPPSAMSTGLSPEKDAKAETKRVSVPTVRNGAPVQGRLTVPPPAPQVTGNQQGKPVVIRRIAPEDDRSGEGKA